MATSSFPLGFLARTNNPSWQDQLRASVRLYLSLSANPSLEHELDNLLQRSEEELLDYLLAGEPPTLAERQQAQHFLDMAQCQLLSSPVEVQLLLAEVTAKQNQPSEATASAHSE